ncbi:MAG: thiosulfate oxidation carrier protein SoxY [bacterium]|nr:thiosulfate oxidation carrier protein SoxY [bacterium]
MNLSRRMFAKGMLATTAMFAFASSLPKALLAAYNKEAFESNKMADAMKAYYGTAETTESDQIKITAPNIAENGAVVPISISSEIDGAESISIFVENNPTPLIGSFILLGAKQNISTRIKMAKTSNLYAVVKAKGKLYATHQEIKVTIGGCGG